MSVATSDSSTEGYRHEAFLYAGSDDFMNGALSFIRDAVASAEPVLVVLAAAKIAALRHELSSTAERVSFADMATVGANPGRIISAWQQFVDQPQDGSSRLRGIGEPIWAGRTAAELDECERHEALLNVAFGDPRFWLLCPYDTEHLAPSVIEEARRNHRFVRENGVSRTSSDFPGPDALAAPFDRPLPDPPVLAAGLAFDITTLGSVRSFVTERAGALGLTGGRVDDLVVAANEVATNTIVHGAGGSSLRMWGESESVVCEVRDGGSITDQLAGRERPAPLNEGRRGLWLANQMCDLVQIRSTAAGTVVRLHVRTR